MTVDVSTAYLLDVAQDKLVEAQVWDAITDQQINDWETLWAKATAEGMVRLADAGIPRGKWPQSLRWNWQKKAQASQAVLFKPGFCVMCQDQTQGLMYLDLARYRARLPSQYGKHLVYVDFVESAPWNRADLLGGVKYRGVGSILLRAAIEMSRAENFGGRIGLHALPQSEEWYRTKCGMTDLDLDPGKQNLRYFEMTAQQADAFVAKGYSK